MKDRKRVKKVVIAGIVVTVLVLIIVGIVFALRRPKKLEMEDYQVETTENLESWFEKEKEMMTGMEVGNQDYVEYQVVTVAESKKEAKKIAEQIGGELLSYENQMAVIQIGVTVEEMMQMLEADPTLPKVYPNYQYSTNS